MFLKLFTPSNNLTKHFVSDVLEVEIRCNGTTELKCHLAKTTSCKHVAGSSSPYIIIVSNAEKYYGNSSCKVIAILEKELHCSPKLSEKITIEAQDEGWYII